MPLTFQVATFIAAIMGLKPPPTELGAAARGGGDCDGWAGPSRLSSRHVPVGKAPFWRSHEEARLPVRLARGGLRDLVEGRRLYLRVADPVPGLQLRAAGGRKPQAASAGEAARGQAGRSRGERQGDRGQR